SRFGRSSRVTTSTGSEARSGCRWWPPSSPGRSSPEGSGRRLARSAAASSRAVLRLWLQRRRYLVSSEEVPPRLQGVGDVPFRPERAGLVGEVERVVEAFHDDHSVQATGRPWPDTLSEQIQVLDEAGRHSHDLRNRTWRRHVLGNDEVLATVYPVWGGYALSL